MNEETFNSIKWPEEFFIVFNDGKRQLFVSSQGVTWDNGQDNNGADENRPSISCCWQKKSPTQQKLRHIEFFVDQIKEISSKTDDTIWSSDA